MVNTLRITSLAAVVLAVIVLASVLGPTRLVSFRMRNDARLERILAEPNVVDRFKENPANKASGSADQTPMLVRQAQDFAKILNPTRPAATTPAAKTGGPVTPPPLPPSSAKFTLIGLSYSAVRPEESFGYIRLSDNTFQWVRKGDEIGHITVREIRRSSILCWDGSHESEMTVTAPPETANLLETAVGTSPGNDNAGTPDKGKVSTSANPGQGNDGALTRVADRMRQLQQTPAGSDPNAMFASREAIMSQLVSELRASQPNGQDAPRLGSPGPDSNESRGVKPSPKRSGYRPSLTSPSLRKPN